MPESPWFLISLMVLGWLIALSVFFLQRRSITRLQKSDRSKEIHLAESRASLEAMRMRLDTVLQLNRELAEAADETALVRAALAAVNRLSSGLGSTYVPFDAWGQPLPAFTYGELPEPVMKGWAEHLVSEHVRQRCSSCQTLHAPPGHACPLQFGPLGGNMNIYCLPLALGEKRLGMVNIYMPAGRELSADLYQFLAGLMNEMALAVEAQRLHDQEVATLRQLHRLRSPRAGLTSTLETLLESLVIPLGLDAISLHVRPMSNERLSGLEVACGNVSSRFFARLTAHWRELIEGEADSTDFYETGWTWIALPLALPEGQVLGVLLAARQGADPFSAHQKGVLETAAAQAALMIENERLNMTLEYTLVIQERTRLAREIHDGLAQMLAFLKMQAVQMQSALTQGDQQRLARLLQESRQTLAEAYNETRQAIDNLRAGSDEGLLPWLSHSGMEFERSTGIRVVASLPEDPPALLPEIQAQLIRIVQEALNNVRKHAQAREVCITLRALAAADGASNGKDWILEIADDGRGFDPEDVPAAARYGLRGMRERAELIGAEFQVASAPARGTLVRVFLPGQLEEMGE